MQLNVILIVLFLLSLRDLILWIPTYVIVKFQSIINPFVLHQVMHPIDACEHEMGISSQDPELTVLLAFTKREMDLHQSLKNCRLC